MRHVFAWGLATIALAGCGGNVVTVGAGGQGTGASTTGSTSSSSSGTTSSTTASSGSGGTSSSSGSGDGCGTCMPTFLCCNGACINPNNDINNCGDCGILCTGANPYCDKGTCGTPPCNGVTCAGTEGCCANECCTTGQLCCEVPGPVALAFPRCTTPVNGTCPAGCTACVCASPDTPIATPEGERPIAAIAAGDLVYSVDHQAIVAVPVLRTNRVPVHDHRVVRVTLASGAVLEVSPRHPTADGRTFGDLHAGDSLDRLVVTSVELVRYAHPFTYDILPASETHAYFAGGALIGSTLPEP